MTAIVSEPPSEGGRAHASDPPTGRVTFLFTDIEGSTKLWERYPDAMRAALARHDALLRQAIEAHGGRVFKTIGDAFCAAFQTPQDGLNAAVDAQRALAAERWETTGPIRARMALHCGEVQFRDNDYFGPPVNRVARLLGVGHGGQVLLSKAVWEEVRRSLPDGVSLRDLGTQRLRDIGQREHICQLLISGLPSVFPKLKTPPSAVPGAIAGGIVALLALALYPVAFGDAQLGLSLFTPRSLLNNLTDLVIRISTYKDQRLLGAALLLLLGTVATVAAWWHAARVRHHWGSDLIRLVGRRVGLRGVAFMAVVTLVVIGAYSYQQYQWRIALPVPEGKLGLAITREASAASLEEYHEQLALGLAPGDSAEQVVVRELPVNFDSNDVEEARSLGLRIDADAVLIYREEASNTPEEGRYVAYVVLTRPHETSVFGDTGSVSTAADASTGELPAELEAGVAVPTLRARTREEVGSDFVNATAGIIAYDMGRYAVAIALLNQAHPENLESPNAGIVNYYLGLAYRMNDQSEEAKAAQERSATVFEQRLQARGALSTQDELILVKAYAERCFLAGLDDDWDGATTWCEKGLPYRDGLLAKADALDRPADVQMAYYWLYGLLADAYGAKQRPEDERYWRTRAEDEAADLGRQAEPDDPYPLIYQARARLYSGDCVGGVNAINQAFALNPTDTRLLRDAHNNLGILYYFQGRGDLAEQEWLQAAALDPKDIVSRENLANLMQDRGLAVQYVDLTYVSQAEDYYRQILAIDPANANAHTELAELAWWRAQGAAVLDSTALFSGDDLATAKSQALWDVDPVRRQTAYDAYGDAIQERRTIAIELRPDDPGAMAEVAAAYEARIELIYSALLAYGIYGPASPDQDAAWVRQTGETLLADIAQVREWSDRVLADPNASRLAMLTAWQARLGALEREWSWYLFDAFGPDPAKATQVEQEFRQGISDAVAFIEAAPIGSTDEIAPARAVYFEALFVARVDGDQSAADGYQAKINDLTSRETGEYSVSTEHLATKCTEERERAAGDEALGTGDAPGAEQHYQAALQVNPQHVPALLGLARARQAQGDLPGAIAQAQAATQVTPNDPVAWELLAYYQFLSGDVTAAGASYDRYVAAVTPLPAQARMASLDGAIDHLSDALDEDPARTAGVLQVVPRFAAVLDGMAADGAGTYQYPALYAALGRLALYADDPIGAEPLLRRAVGFEQSPDGAADCQGYVPTACDAHQPVAWADLALAAIAQGRDGTAELDAAMRETEADVWLRIDGYDPASLRSQMRKEARAYAKRFPDRAGVVDSFEQAIDAEKERLDLLEEGVDGAAYRSPTYGVTLSWEPAWTIADVSSDQDPGIDVIRLSNGVSDVLVETASSHADPVACIEGATEHYRGISGWSDFEPEGRPKGRSIGASVAPRGSAAYSFTWQSQRYVLYLECRAAPSGQFGVLVTAIIPAASYEAQRQPVNQLLATLQAPAESTETAAATAATPAATPVAGADVWSPVVLPELDPDVIVPDPSGTAGAKR